MLKVPASERDPNTRGGKCGIKMIKRLSNSHGATRRL